MSAYTLRVVWPVLDDSMSEARVKTEAFFQLPEFAEDEQATVTGQPQIHVYPVAEDYQVEVGATRIVVCEAPAMKRIAVAA